MITRVYGYTFGLRSQQSHCKKRRVFVNVKHQQLHITSNFQFQKVQPQSVDKIKQKFGGLRNKLNESISSSKIP